MSSIALNLGITGNGKTKRTLMLMELYPEKTPYVVDPTYQYVKFKNIKQINPSIDIRIPLQRIKNGLIIIDEAQLYFTHAASNAPLIAALSVCRHNNSMTILNFHTLRQVPIYIIDYVNQIVLGHTNDEISEAKRYGRLRFKIEDAMRKLDIVRDTEMHAAILIDNI